MKGRIPQREKASHTLDSNPRASKQAPVREILQARKGETIRFDAGKGDSWHIHKDHVKYDSNNETRVNFTGRTKETILEKIDEVLGRYPKLNKSGIDKCRKYIDKYY
jgi:hypothetical protein